MASGGLQMAQTSKFIVRFLSIFDFASFDTPHCIVKDIFKNSL